MGCGMMYLKWLSDQGHLPLRGRVLDIGESCLLGATAAELRLLLRRHGCTVPDEELNLIVDRFAYRSTLNGDPNIPTLFLSEFCDLTDIEYVAFDVVAAKKAERFDLNVHTLAGPYRGTFDLVLNFGTTEHLLNQYNAMRVIHDAVRPGGGIFHSVPFTGFLKHGYFCYTPLVFRDVATANGYEVTDLWFSGPMGNGAPVGSCDTHPGLQDPTKPENDIARQRSTPVPDNLINALLKKPADDANGNAPFRLMQEIRTAAGGLDERAYTSPYIHVEPGPAPPRLDVVALARPDPAPPLKPGLFRRLTGAFKRTG